MIDMIKRWQAALARIDRTGGILALPEQVQDVLKSTGDLTVKALMLEVVADAMRKELEQKLFDLRYDMDCIADGGQELKQAIAGLTDEELTELIAEYEED